MKKTKIIKAILAPIGKGILTFAVFGFAMYVYAAVVDFPDTSPTPVSGVVGMFVDVSTSSTNGAVSGYNNANETYCDIEGDAVLDGAHICTAMEIINTYNNNPSALPSTGSAWINNGPPGYDQTQANDCMGWGSLDGEVFGSIWKFDTDDSSISPCSLPYQFACCK